MLLADGSVQTPRPAVEYEAPASGDRPGPANDDGRRLIVDGLVNYSGMAVAAVVGILLVPLMLGRLGTDRYGLWLAAIALSAALRAVDLGLGLVVVREVAGAAGEQRHRRAAPLVNAAAGAHLLLGLAGAVLIAAAAVVLTVPLRLPVDVQPMVVPVFSLLGIAFIAEQWIVFASAVLTGLRRFGTLNLIGIALVLTRAVGIVVLLVLGSSLVTIAGWYATATFITAGFAVAAVRATPGGDGVGLPRWNWRLLRRHVPFGLASFATGTAAGMSWQALPFLTAVLLGAGAVVPLHLGQKIPLALTGLYTRLASVVFPAASEHQRTNNVEGTQAVLKTGSRLLLHLMVPIVVVSLFAAPGLLHVWVGDPAPGVVLIFRVTLLAVLADALGSVASSVLWGRGQMRPVLVTTLLSTAAVAGGAVLVLPRLGPGGGAALLALVFAAASVAFWVLASRAAEVRPLHFARVSGRGIALPLFACAAASAAVLAVPGPATLLQLVSAYATGTGAYLWMLARYGHTAEEAAIGARAARIPRQLFLPAARRIGARWPALRSFGYLLLSIRAMVVHPARNLQKEFDRTFAAAEDPWDYGERTQRERVSAAMGQVDALRTRHPGSTLTRVLEIGCAEGTVTELLAPRCRRLVAADISAVALARCEKRCGAHPGIQYRLSDFAGAAVWGPYDLVVAMDVLECIRSPLALRRARSAAAEMLLPGGHLIVTTTRQHPIPETAGWGRWLPVGARINEFVARHPGLRVVHSATMSTHVLTVYRKLS
jgi:O-antigen/teichoic acid export membrane protein